MKNDFTNIFKAVEPSEREAFKQYIVHFYGQQKAVLNTFEQAAKSVTEQREQGFLFDIKNDKKALNDLSELKGWLLEFLTVQEVKKNTYDVKFLTLEALKRRGLQGVLLDKSKMLHQELSKHENPDIWLNLLKLRLNHAAYFNTENEKLENHQLHLNNLLTQLDNFYIGTKLKYTAELESRKNILQEVHNPRLLSEILTFLETDSDLNPIIKDLYLPLLKLIKDKSETAYFELKDFLNKKQMPDRHEKLAVLVYLLNFTAQRMAKGDVHYNIEYFELAKMGIEQSLFTVAKYFPTTTFNNIVNVSNNLKKYDWVKQFIKDWSIHLKPNDQIIGRELALARVYFEEKNFNDAYDSLQKIKGYRNLHFTLQARVLLVCTCYEKKEPESTQKSYCEALDLYIRRNLDNQNLKEPLLNFIKIFRLLINKKPKKQILKTLETMQKSVVWYEWLTLKIDELKS
jgi:hypothetical protein